MQLRERLQQFFDPDLHDKEVLQWQRLLLVNVFTISAGSALLFHFYELQHLRDNFYTLAPAMQYLIRNVLDFIGNIEPIFAIGGLLPVILDAGLTGIETCISVKRGKRSEVPYAFRLVFMSVLLLTLTAYNFDTELWQKLPGSYGEPNIKDIFPGMLGILSAALLADAMRTIFRKISGKFIEQNKSQEFNIN